MTVPCGVASDSGEYPNLFDTHNVWNNANSDGSFGVTSPIFLDDITADGWTLGTLPIPTDKMVTSFSSKSELALNRSTTSTISANGDTGADPNKLVKVTDRVSDSTLPTGEGYLEHFFTIRSAKAREVLRGVALAPGDDDGFFGW